VQALRGLDFLHSLQPAILHRDIKYANLLIDSQGTARRYDLGCAKAEGTYLAYPEQEQETRVSRAVAGLGCGGWRTGLPHC
jgi:serine/threonine protein kinase